MAWLLFMDESGHDHKTMPLEVRGGIALHTAKIWDFVQSWQRLERDCFGIRLADVRSEAKGAKLLDRDRMRWAHQMQPLSGDDRRKFARRFLLAPREGRQPSRIQFTAYGQACLEMARGTFELLGSHEGRLFACAIPRGIRPPQNFLYEDYLRKDHVFLFERFYYFLEHKHEHGLLIMDETDKVDDKRFVAKLEQYFTKTATGRNRSYWIVPAPLFVSSEMTHAVQAADVCLYCLNWGFRPNAWPDIDGFREDIAGEFGPKIARMQWDGDAFRDGRVFRTWSIVFVPDPYEGRNAADRT